MRLGRVFVSSVFGTRGVFDAFRRGPAGSDRLREEDSALRAVVPTFLLLDNFEDNQDEEGRLRTPELGAALLDLARLGGPGSAERFGAVELEGLGECNAEGLQKLPAGAGGGLA
jgi:hypothetical protein